MRAVRESIRQLRALLPTGGSKEKMFAAVQAGELGTRVLPAKGTKHNKIIGIRMDRGKRYFKDGEERQSFNIQVNKEAEDPTLRKLAQKDSHKIWAMADIAVGPKEDPTQAVNDFFDRLEASVDDGPSNAEDSKSSPSSQSKGSRPSKSPSKRSKSPTKGSKSPTKGSKKK